MCDWDIELDGVIDVYKQQILDGIQIIQQDFPFLKSIPLRISTEWNDTGNPATIKPEKCNHIYRHVIYLSAYYFKNEYRLSELKGNDQNRFLGNFSSVITHELGHILQDLYCSKTMFPCKYLKSNRLYFKYFRSSFFEERYLKKIRKVAWNIFDLDEEQCAFYLGENSVETIYEFFADCFNTYYYLLGEDTASRKGTREYYAFKISESIINTLKSSF